MAITALEFIVDDLNPHLHKFWVNGSTIAGSLVYASENDGVTMTTGPTYIPVGVALQSLADNALVTVAMPPTIAYLTVVNDDNVSVGKLVMPSTAANGALGGVVNFSGGTSSQNVAVGTVLGWQGSNTSVAKVQLSCVRTNVSYC